MNNSPKIKFCGLKKIEDVELALKLNIDYVGFIYVKNTPRYISFENSKNIINKFNKKVNFIGVFLNHSDDYIEKGVKCGINLIQLHGNETPTRCKEIKNNFNLPIIKAIPIFKQKDILEVEKYNDCCDMFLFDTKTNGENKYNGGTGKSFDWHIIKNNSKRLTKLKPWILSGGLNLNNISKAIEITKTKYVDVSSGIEYSLGKKSQKLMKEFVLNTKI